MKDSMNITLAQKVIEELVIKGVRSFCICPGGRLAPFVELLSQTKGLELFSFFEERSAGFFALGRVRRDDRPIAVLTTSGTAVAELMPSVIEAHYNSLPLVLISSDRPLMFGKHGAPQTLKNTLSILKSYCCISQNILKQEDINLSNWNPSQGSLHLNVCFDEPLIDEKITTLDFSDYQKSAVSIYPSATFKKEDHDQMKLFFQSCSKPLLLISELKLKEQPFVQNLLNHYKGLFYIEALANLQNTPGRLLSGERILNYALKKKEIDGVIRLGGMPRVRFWRDLEKHSIPVLNLSSPPFYRGLARTSLNFPLLESLDTLKNFLLPLKDYGSGLKDFDQNQLKKLKSIIKDFPQSEEFWFWILKKHIKENSKVFLGNSSPIRLWDMMVFEEKKNLFITGQAGVNGIDGQLSRFLGECSPDKNNIGIIGDLSLLYDIPGFWRSKELPHWTLIVINNYGGQIFSRLFQNKAFINPHKLSFSSLADMWSLAYESYNQSSDFSWSEKPYSLLEIQPDMESTKKCFEKTVSIWDI